MLEQITIVLNEREPLKQKAAEDIASALAERKITSDRPKIGPKIEQILLENESQVLVLDYVLGDYSTGLDILTKIRQKKGKPSSVPAVIFFTDEPSLDVAVEAMRLGAKNFILMDSPGALLTLVEEIERLIVQKRTERFAVVAEDLSFEDLTVNSQVARRVLQSLRELVLEGNNPLVFVGERGTGKKRWAKATFGDIGLLPVVDEIDVRFIDSNISKLFERYVTAHEQGGLYYPGALLLTHIESDETGSLLSYIERNRSLLLSKRSNGHPLCYIFATTTKPETAQAWKSLLGAGLISLPNLDGERLDDFASLIQDTIERLNQSYSSKLKPLSANEIRWLSSQKWRGNIGQLRSVVIQALTMSLEEDRPVDELLKEVFEFSDQDLQERTAYPVNEFEAARLYDATGGNIRLTAAQLGCTISTVKSILERFQSPLPKNANGNHPLDDTTRASS